MSEQLTWPQTTTHSLPRDHDPAQLVGPDPENDTGWVLASGDKSDYIRLIQVPRQNRKLGIEPSGAQLALELPSPGVKSGHGGKRAGAGRPKLVGRSDSPHRARPVHRKRHPVHVVLRAVKDVPRLRRRNTFAAIRTAMKKVGARLAFRVVHASIQKNHLHFIVEAEDKAALTAGMRAFAISLARRINIACGRTGQVFAHRYHATVIKTPRQARNTLAYVLNNWRHHNEDEGSLRSRTAALDPYATGVAFDGWREAEAWGAAGFETLPAVTPETWLLKTGWRLHYSLISVREVPKLVA